MNSSQIHRVSQTMFRLFNRRLHPELFEVLSSREVNKGKCNISVQITPTGHLLQWQMGEMIVVELTAGPQQTLPARGQLIAYSFDGSKSGDCLISDTHRYRVLSQVEKLNPTDYETVHDELLVDGRQRGLLVCRMNGTRSILPAISWVDVTPLVGGLALSTIHTYPNELAIAKTQSLITPI